jgi:hypothetical protein
MGRRTVYLSTLPALDSQGNLYVLEWLSTGRITKLKRLK